jgi:hypothetical protein
MKLICGFCDRVIVNNWENYSSDSVNELPITIICGECYVEYKHLVLFTKFQVEMLKENGY